MTRAKNWVPNFIKEEQRKRQLFLRLLRNKDISEKDAREFILTERFIQYYDSFPSSTKRQSTRWLLSYANAPTWQLDAYFAQYYTWKEIEENGRNPNPHDWCNPLSRA